MGHVSVAVSKHKFSTFRGSSTKAFMALKWQDRPLEKDVSSFPSKGVEHMNMVVRLLLCVPLLLCVCLRERERERGVRWLRFR